MIKKTILLIFVLSFVTILWSNSNVYTFSTQPPLSRTGAPGEQHCAGSGCHVGAPIQNSPDLLIGFGDEETSYLPGTTYDMTITLPASARSGFEIVALDDSNNNAGNFVTDGVTTGMATSPSNGRVYAFHKNAVAGVNSFSFQWISPTNGVGDVTFYASGNQANGSGAGGDMIHLNSLTIGFEPVGIEQANTTVQATTVYPNPAREQVYIDYELKEASAINISLIDLQGKTWVSEQLPTQTPGVHTQRIGLENTPAGIYVLQVQGVDFTTSKKVTVQ